MMFSLFMLIFLLVTGLIWLLDIALLKKRRPAGQAEPLLVEYAKSFFPVILDGQKKNNYTSKRKMKISKIYSSFI